VTGFVREPEKLINVDAAPVTVKGKGDRDGLLLKELLLGDGVADAAPHEWLLEHLAH